MQASSGTTAKASTTDAAVTAIATTVENIARARHARLVNEGGVAGFISFDGGTTKHRFPADQLVNTFYDLPKISSVLLYRIASGTDIASCYVEIWG